jgi:hypothetical protein
MPRRAGTIGLALMVSGLLTMAVRVHRDTAEWVIT